MQSFSPLSFVLFGATGDLAQRKIVPALLNLYTHQKLPQEFTLLAFSRRPWSDEDYRTFITPSLQNKNIPQETIESFLKHIVYVEGTFDTQESYTRLKNKIYFPQIIYHLAVQPEFYKHIIEGIGKEKNNGRIIIEKPFGKDTPSAARLAEVLHQYFSQDQIYLIDHYLAKPGALALENSREYLDTSKSIESVRVRILESIDIAGRGEFYDTIGALRDVGQNHALEMAALIGTSSSHSREEFLENIKPLSISDLQENVTFGQYEGYTQEKDVAPDSTTETYFEIGFEVDDTKWKDVKFIIEGGKALGKKVSEIIITYKDKTQKIINLEEPVEQPNENISLRDAYEVLIEEVIREDKHHFVSINEVQAAWKFITPILEHKEKVPLKIYKKGIYPLQ